MGFFVSAVRRYGARALGPFLDKFLYRRAADTIVMLTPFKFSFICIGGLPIRMALSNDSIKCTVVSAGCQYQGSVVIIDFDLVHPTLIPVYHFGIDGPPIPKNSRHEVWASGRIGGPPTHLEFNEIGMCTYISIGGWACSIGGSNLLVPVSSSAIGGLIPRIGGHSKRLLSHVYTNIVTSASTTLPRCYAIELSDISISVRTKRMIANPSFGDDSSLFVSTASQNPTHSLFCAHSKSLSAPHLRSDSLTSRQCTLDLLVICAWTYEDEVSAHFPTASERTERWSDCTDVRGG